MSDGSTTFWRQVDQHIADWMAAHARQTGITPNVPLGGLVFDRYGRAVSGQGAGVVAIYDLSANATKAGGFSGRINFDSQLYDPQSLVTVGASWHFTPTTPGWYGFKVHSEIEPAAALSSGESLAWVLWPDAGGTNIQNMARLEVGITETGTRTLVILESYIELNCTTSSAVNLRFANGTANNAVLVGDGTQIGANRVVIVKL